MHCITKRTDFGRPYTYFDGAKNLRLVSPEYGGDGMKTATAGTYSTPVLTFHSRRAAPVDLLFYSGRSFPREYRGGAFIVLHARRTRSARTSSSCRRSQREVGSPIVFADGFAGFDRAATNRAPASYRPIGIAEGPDGALYVADSKKGRIWRIAYQDGASRQTAGR